MVEEAGEDFSEDAMGVLRVTGREATWNETGAELDRAGEGRFGARRSRFLRFDPPAERK